MTMIYESPDRGKTIHARALNDYSHQWRVGPPRHGCRSWRSPLADAADQFSRIEQAPGTAADPADQRHADRQTR